MLCEADRKKAGRLAEWGVPPNDGRAPSHLLMGLP